MGIPAASSVTGTPAAGDQANAVLTGTLTSATVSPFFPFFGQMNVSVWGTFVGTVLLQRSFDGGLTFLTRNDANGSGSYTAGVSFVVGEPERGVLYQLNCSAYTSGTINYRISQTGSAARSADVGSAL